MPDLPTLLSGQAGLLAAAGVVLVYAAGIASAIDAVMHTRTSQGATAWVFALATLPLVAIPLYFVFGRSHFDDYRDALDAFDAEIGDNVRAAHSGPLAPLLVPPTPGDGPGEAAPDATSAPVGLEPDADPPPRERGEMLAFGRMATLPFTRGNGARLLIDGRQTFDALFAGIDAAERYVLAQFYIIHDDEIGRAFQQRLIAAARRGVRVRLMYDTVGSLKLPRRYLRELRDAGAEVCAFTGPRNWLRKLRLNFRNHRKIVVADGTRAWAGGLNVGDEYLGRDPDIGPWRDTHLEVEGPVVQGLQLSFARDWYYGTRDRIDGELVWEPAPSAEDRTALVLASGPADAIETCGLLYAHTIESAERRIWIATPYFVPDGRVLGALQLAALRGVDVRILMPRTSDSVFFKYVPYAYLDDVARAGVRVHLYEPGFLHQKVALVDRDFAAVGTANFDNRSFRLNFEATVVVRDGPFCDDVEAMLLDDFARSTEITADEMADKPFAFRFAANATRLLAPVL